MAEPVDCGVYPFLSLTASGEESPLTRSQAALFLSLNRHLVPSGCLFSFDIHDDRPSSFHPADTATLKSLARIFTRLLIDKGLLHQDTGPAGHPRVRLGAPLIPSTEDSIHATLIRPASIRPVLLDFLRKGTVFARTPAEEDPGALHFTAACCPACHRLFNPGRNCPRHPEAGPPRPVHFQLSGWVQRLIWLSCRISLPSSRLTVGTLVCEPRLRGNPLGLLFSFLLLTGRRFPFREIILWPRQPFPGQRSRASAPTPPAPQALLSLWPGWKGPASPPEGRIRFVQRLDANWESLRQVLRSRAVRKDPERENSGCSRRIDRWLLHSLNLTVAAFLDDEEQRRPDLGLEKLARFMKKELIGAYLAWRRSDWDPEARDVLAMAMNVLSELALPYGLDFPPPREQRSAAVPIRMYRRDWIFPEEHKLLTGAREICRAIHSLRGEIQRAGFSPEGPVYLASPLHRSLPRDLGRLLKRLLPRTELEYSAENRLKTIFGLRGVAGPWRITQALSSPVAREELVRHYQERLNQDQGIYERCRSLYESSKGEGVSQNQLKAMRRKLLSLKKRQMRSLERIHELQ